MGYRNYQIEDFEAIKNNYQLGFNSQLVIQATGLGKTKMMAGISDIQSELGLFGKIFVLVNRVELVEQTRDEFAEANPSLKIGIEQANNRADKDCHVVIGSVQTLGTAQFDENGNPVHKPRLLQIDPSEYSVILVDETHRAPANTFRSVIMYFGAYPGRSNYRPWVLLLGFTATPNRMDNKGLEEFYSCVACNRNIVWGIENNWLTDIKAYRVSTSVNLDDHEIGKTKTVTGTDLSAKDLSKAINIPARNKLIIQRVMELHEGRRGVFFCVDVQHAKDLCQMANDMGMTAKCVFGATDKTERKDTLNTHKNDEFTALLGCNVFCLDSQTEILTRGGWKGIDTINDQDLVANWDNWNIFFDKPKQIFKRNTFPGEKMVSIKSRTLDMRLTPDHNCVTVAYRNSIKKRKAIDIAGLAVKLPVGGVAKPESGLIPTPEKRRNSQCPKQRLRCNRFFIKRETGMQEPWVTQEAKRRMAERDNMRYKTPEELTDAECFLIGFWIGDGGVYKLTNGGREHKISQADCNMWATNLVRNALVESGIKFNESLGSPRDPKDSHYTLFSFSPGTGSGNQKVRGCYHIEPYLNKKGSDLLWGLNQRQFDEFIRGLWSADGDHGDGTPKKTMRIYSATKQMLDLVQAIASCRGYRTILRKAHMSNRKENHNQLYVLTLSKQKNLYVSTGTATGNNQKFLSQETNSTKERVWCVKSTSGNIIARRNGHVFVTGNCEGYNDPGMSFVAMCRPTQSRTFYTQAIGRALRPFPAPESLAYMRSQGIEPEWIKPYAILIDFCDLSSKHNLVTVGSIFGVGSKFDFKGKEVAKEAKKIKEEVCKLDEKIQASVEEHINDISSIEDLRSIVERINLLQPPSVSAEVATISSLEWLKVAGRYEISLPSREVIRVTEDALGFTIHRSVYGNSQIIAQKNSLEAAIKYAEDKLIPDDSLDILRAEAVWRSKKPSDKQIEYLGNLRKDLKQKFGGNDSLFHEWVRKNYSKGQVSNLINEAAIARDERKVRR